MKRLLFCLILACPARRLFAQDVPEVIHLTVKANPAPVPALKYTLLPRALDIRPGNAATVYYRSFSPEWWGSLQRQPREYWEKVDAARKLPLELVKAQELFIPMRMLKEVDRAARREYCDWELAPRIAEEGVGVLLPDLQGMRQIVNFLSIRARREMADGDIDAAIYTIQTGLQLAKHVCEGATFINSLVGIAIGAITCQQLEELIQLPQAPNLYWALSQLPRPFVDLRKPLAGEQWMIEHEFAKFRELENGPISPERADKVLDYLVSRSPYWDIKMDKAKLIEEFATLYPKAKKALAAGGVAAADIEKMPVSQVVLLHSMRELQRMHDERAKWMAMPYVEGGEGLNKVDEGTKKMVTDHEALSFVTEFGGGLHKVYAAQLRIDRKFAILRCVEAIKLHAAETGKLPSALSDIKVVPVPLDPMSDKPFDYRLDSATAVVTAPLHRNVHGSGWQYEIKLLPAADKK
jgi:hypothetical protein